MSFLSVDLAFPSNSERGMTLRDWFAGQVITGLCASDRFNRSDWANEAQVEWAYELADAMMRARDAKPAAE